jgi:integrase
MRKALTEKTLAGLKPDIKRYEVRDLHFPGFGVRVSRNGRLTFFISYRYGTIQRRKKIGIYPRVALQEARTRALADLRLVDEGIDPARTQRTQDFLVCNVVEEFIEKYAKVKTRGWKASHALLKREIVGPHGQRDIRKIERSDIIAILDDMIAKGHNAQANRFLAYARRMFGWCVERDIITVSPTNGIKAPCKEQARERVLSDDEIARILPVCRKHGYPFGSLFQVLLLTAQRRGEVSGMRWSEVDLINRVWHLPSHRTKNGHAHSVPLSDAVMNILNVLPRFADSDLVFTTNGRTPVSGWGKPVKRLSDEAKVHNWHIHDMRRTAASGMARLGVQPYVVEKILNHVTGQISGVAATYNRYGYDQEKRTALENWSAHLSRL